MTARDVVLAALTSVIWGFGFVVGIVGLESFSPALLAPCTGVLSAALLVGEVPSPIRWAGMALIVSGLAVIVCAPATLSAVVAGPRSSG